MLSLGEASALVSRFDLTRPRFIVGHPDLSHAQVRHEVRRTRPPALRTTVSAANAPDARKTGQTIELCDGRFTLRRGSFLGAKRSGVETSGCGREAQPRCRQISPFRSASSGPPVEMTPVAGLSEKLPTILNRTPAGSSWVQRGFVSGFAGSYLELFDSQPA